MRHHPIIREVLALEKRAFTRHCVVVRTKKTNFAWQTHRFRAMGGAFSYMKQWLCAVYRLEMGESPWQQLRLCAAAQTDVWRSTHFTDTGQRERRKHAAEFRLCLRCGGEQQFKILTTCQG